MIQKRKKRHAVSTGEISSAILGSYFLRIEAARL